MLYYYRFRNNGTIVDSHLRLMGHDDIDGANPAFFSNSKINL